MSPDPGQLAARTYLVDLTNDSLPRVVMAMARGQMPRIL